MPSLERARRSLALAIALQRDDVQGQRAITADQLATVRAQLEVARATLAEVRELNQKTPDLAEDRGEPSPLSVGG